MYYLIKPDGTSIFEQGYCYDFIMHCLFNLIDNPDSSLRSCKVLYIDTACQRGTAAYAVLPKADLLPVVSSMCGAI